MRTLKPRVSVASTELVRSHRSSDERVTGSALQRIRRELWVQSPVCAVCGIAVAYPQGFELDHIVPLWAGGADVPDNRQILCVWWDEAGKKRGCHADKTAKEAKIRG